MKPARLVFSCLLLATCYLLLTPVTPAHAILENTKGAITDSNIQSEPLKLGVSLGSVTSVRDLKDYIALAYRYAIGIVVICAIVMLVYGGFRYLIGSAMGDMSKAKKIIFDALMGLVIVLGAYLILQTVNKATLTLKVPNLTGVGNRAACLGFVSCQFDKDCQTSDQDGLTNCGANGRCLLIGEEGRGYCTTGAEHQLCHDTQEVPAKAKQECQSSEPDKQCNNNGSGDMNCQAGTRCVLSLKKDSDMDSTYRFICRKSREVKTVENNQDEKVSQCTTDLQCEDKMGSGSACIRVSGFGYCSDGSEGMRCRCTSEDGCWGRAFLGRETNNGSTGEMACKRGLECVLFEPVGKTDGKWYCQKILAPAK